MGIKLILFFGVLFSALSVQSATYTVTTSSDQGIGSLRYFIDKANANPGLDIIEIPAAYNEQNPLTPNLGYIVSGQSDNRMTITDDIIIRGLGNDYIHINDHQRWVSSDGLLNAGYPSDSNNTIIKPSGLLFRINPNNIAARTIDVTIENVWAEHMSGFINSDNANITLNKVLLYKIVPRRGNTSVMSTQDGIVTIKDSLIFENLAPRSSPTFIFNSSVFIENTAFQGNGPLLPNSFSHVIQVFSPVNDGSTKAVIKDSLFKTLSNSTFKFINVDTTIVNTLFDGTEANRGWPIYADNGTLTLTNSTLYYPAISKNVDPTTYKATHIELINGAQLIANNSLLFISDGINNVGPTIYPTGWDNTAVYPLAQNSNNYFSTVGVDDFANTGLSVAGCSTDDCFVPNTLSIALVDQGDDTKAIYPDGTSITSDYLKEIRPQGASIDIGAYEKHESLYAHPDTYTVEQDTKLTVSGQEGVLKNDTNENSFSAVLDQDALNGSVTLNADGSFEYQPNADYYGNDEFYYSINTSQAKVSITVLSTGWTLIPNNAAPIAKDDSYSLYADSIDTIVAPGVLYNDTDDANTQAPFYAGLTARVYKQPMHGTVTLKENGEFIYTPDAGFIGNDSFEYDVTDIGFRHSFPATVNLQVQAGVPHGGKVIAGTSSGGSIGFLSILLLTMFALVRNQKSLAVKIAVPLLISLSPLAHAAEENNGIYVTINPGVSWLEPDTDHNAWSQESNSQFSFGSSLGYQFDNNASIQFTYRWLNSVDLKAEHPQYNNMTVDYQHYSFNFVYRVTQLWGDQFAPYFSLGLGYLDASSNNAEDFEVEDNVHPNIGVGVNVLNFGQFKSDLQWHRLSGDVDTLELVFSYHFK
ncbi:Ig-like domain-containing protein [Vibrio chagasii]|uniref:Ig-like domain-containing protein n=1 Tax=Vibrio chagasii TaxID=170679 RepID=UPI003DA1BA9A